MIDLSRDEARELAVAAQGLSQPDCQPATAADALQTVRMLGCVQIDTIHVVARSQYLVLWSRLGHYDSSWLDDLLHPDRQVFEYWAHAASLIPTELYPYFRRRMQRYAGADVTDGPGWSGYGWAVDNAHLLDEIRGAIRQRGPLGSMHFDAPQRDTPLPSWSWWGGKPANRGLDFLWSAGELGIQRRVRFQRIYDLTERLYPEWHSADLPDPDEERRVLADRALRAMGITLPRWLNDYFRTKWGVRGHAGPGPTAVLDDLVQHGRAFPVEVDGFGTAYVAAEAEGLLQAVRRGARAERVTLLSPFDNLIWDRRRTRELFDFDYMLECYTPAAKRRYGYFTLPILFGGRLVGRVEPKVHRRERVLTLRSVHLEPGAPSLRALADGLRPALRSFAEFNGADTIQVENAPPDLIEALSIA